MKRLLPLLTLGACLVAQPATAAVFCVSNSAQLDAALNTASNNGSDDQIRVQIGVYTDPDAFFYASAPASNESLAFSGGWISFLGACDTQFPDASLTAIDGIDGGRGILFQLQGIAPGNLSVSNFSVVGARTEGTEMAGLAISTSSPSIPPAVSVYNVIVRDGLAQRAGIALFGDMQVTVRNTLVANNRGSYATGLIITPNGTGPIQLNHVTVADNTAGTSTYSGLLVQANAATTVSNSIAWGNRTSQGAVGDCDISFLFGTGKLVNVISDRTCGNVDAASSGIKDQDPQFLGAGDYRTKTSSPARDTGLSNPVGGLVTRDLAGSDRTLGTKPDLGAYENTGLFSDQFE